MTVTATTQLTRVHAGVNTRAARLERLAELAAQGTLDAGERDRWLTYLADLRLPASHGRYLFAELVDAIRLRNRVEQADDVAEVFPGRPDLTRDAALQAVCQNVDVCLRPLVNGDTQ